jgi:ParB-like chromosome segregation protein Spo0J
MGESLKTGGDLEPLVVVVIDAVVTLVDGHHRYRALLSHGLGSADVLVLRGDISREEARWLAFWLHWRAALPLTRKERRAGFCAYVEAGHHRATRFGRIKTYRDIAKDLGLPRSTLWHWMREKFPAIAAKMAKEVVDEPRDAGAGDRSASNLRAIRHHAGQLALLAGKTSAVADEARNALIEALRRSGETRPLETVLSDPNFGYDF